MDTINWHDVAEKIRAREFSEIPNSTWDQIAENIDVKKRGRKPRPVLEYREDWSLEDIHKADKRDISIVVKYERLLSRNVKSKKAIYLISEGLDANEKPDLSGPPVMSEKNVERIITAWRKMEKELKEMIQSEP